MTNSDKMAAMSGGHFVPKGCAHDDRTGTRDIKGQFVFECDVCGDQVAPTKPQAEFLGL